MTDHIKVKYDEKSDVLYLTKMPGVAASSDEGAPGVLWRHSLANGKVVGVTILDFHTYWSRHIDKLIPDLSKGLSVTEKEAKRLLPRGY